MKRKKAGLYDPYLDTLGGGERHILSILKVLEDEGFEISVFWDINFKTKIEERFNLKFKTLQFRKNILKSSSQLTKLKDLSNFDIFFYVTDGSYFISTARKNYVFLMVPKKELLNMSLLNRIKLANWNFIVNSHFTQKFLKNWGVKSSVLYHYLDDNFINSSFVKKEKIILTVGRFFSHLHAKKHDLIIELFKKNQNKFSSFKLILAGGLNKEDEKYFNKLKKLVAGNNSIELKVNVSYQELLNLYKRSMIYWHFAGFGIDEDKNPELVEHFGITPLEAMATGCITFVYAAGGPKEIIQDGKNGFLFKTEKELISKTHRVIENQSVQNKIRQNAKEFVKRNFSYEVLRKKVRETIL